MAMDTLASCSDVVRLWEAGGTGLVLQRTIDVKAAATNSCCWNHNGQVVATAGDDGSITVIKVGGIVVPAGVLSAKELPLRGIAFSSKSRIMAAGGDAGVVEVWWLKRNNSRVTMRGHRGPVTCVSFFEHDTRVAAGDARGRVLLHRVDVPNDEAPVSLPPAGGHASVTGLSVTSTEPTTMGVSHSDGTVRVWDVGRRACVREIQDQHRGSATGVDFHPHNPSLIATVGHDGIARFTDVRIGDKGGSSGGRLLKSIETGVPLTCVSFHHEGLKLGVGASDGNVRLIDLRTAREAGLPVKAYAGPTPPSGGVRDVAFQLQPFRSGAGAIAGARVASENGLARHAAPAAVSAVDRGLMPASTSTRHGPEFVPDDSKYTAALSGNGVGSAATRSASAGRARRRADGVGVAGARARAAAGRGNRGDGSGVQFSATTGSSRHRTNGKGLAGSLSAPPPVRSDNSIKPAAAATSRASSKGNGHTAGTTGGDQNVTVRREVAKDRGYGGSGRGARNGETATVAGRSLSSPPARRRSRSPERHGGRRQSAGGDRRRQDGSGGGEVAADADDEGPHAPPQVQPSASSRPGQSSSSLLGRQRQQHQQQAVEDYVPPQDEEHAWSRRRQQNSNDNKDAAFLSPPSSREKAEDGDARASLARDHDWGHQDDPFALQNGRGGGDLEGSFTSPTRAPRKSTHADFCSSPTAVASSAGMRGEEGGGGSREGGTAGAGLGRASTAMDTAAGGRVVSMDRSVLEQVLSNHVSGLREELRQELRNLHVDMLRQFHSLQDEQASAMSGFEERLGGLVAENQALRAENDRLRRVY